ncbi:MAG: sulfate transporter family protein [Xanthobacteraceae bacterium]
MLDAAAKSLTQILSPPFRAVLLKSMGLAAVLLVVAAIALHRLITWLVGGGETWLEGALGPIAHIPLAVVFWLLAFAAALGLFVGVVFLMPAVTALVAGLFGDDIAEQVERTYYPADPPGTAVPIGRALVEAVKIALASIVVYLCAVPFLFFGIGAVIFFLATAYLQSRQYFELAAMRFHPPAEAKGLRKAHQGTVFVAGMVIAGFVSIPIVNLATPLFGTALMVHLHKRLAGSRRELLEPRR